MTTMDADTLRRTSGSRSIRAMGNDASIQVVGLDVQRTERLLDQAVRRIEHLEARWSRFLPTSDISRLNATSGTVLDVDPDTNRLIVAMVQGWRASDGAYDPTLLGALNALGYATDWSDASRPSCAATGGWRGDPGGILLDPVQHRVQLPLGTSLDAGGIGKGLAADVVADAVMAAGADGVAVTIGGDLRVRGEAPSGDGWRIGVADPADDTSELAQLCVLDGGVATSSIRRRRWWHNGASVHHLLDPDTGSPAATDVVQATVVAGTGAWAEVWSKAIVVRGIAAVHPVLEQLGLAAMSVCTDGSIHCTRSWDRYGTPQSEVGR
jgi:thiamine biosynthesis lipoprotein